MEEAASYPGIAGVQLDDHFCLPVAVAGRSAAQAGRGATLEAAAAAMTTAAELLTTRLRRSAGVRSGVRMSLSPAPLGFALSKYAVDWKVSNT